MSIIHSYTELLIAGALLTILLFLSWIGFGYLLSRTLKLQRLPWGQTAAIGMSAVIFLGGIQALAGTVSAWSNFLIVLTGSILFIIWAIKSYKKNQKKPPFALFKSLHDKRDAVFTAGFLALRIATFFLLGVMVLGALQPHWYNACDDKAAYFVFPKIMLETHTLIEPFNLRRLGTLGGAAYLQTFLYPVFYFLALPVTDAGLGGLLIWAVTLGFFEKRGKNLPVFYFKRELAGLMSLFISASVILHNHMPVFIPFALVLCLVSLCLRYDTTREAGWREMLLLCLVAGSLISIRNNFIVFALVLPIFYIWTRKNLIRDFLELLKQNSVFLVLLLLYLAPWMLLSYRSSGTPFFPLIRGNYSFPHGFSEPLGLGEKAGFVLENILGSGSPLIYFGMLSITFFLLKSTKTLVALALAVFAGIILTSLSLTASDSYNITRYTEAFSYAGLAALLAMTFTGQRRIFFLDKKKSAIALQVLALTLIVVWFNVPFKIHFKWDRSVRTFVYTPFDFARSNVRMFYVSSGEVFEKGLSLSRWIQGDAADYRAVQQFLPAGAKVISAADRPFYWDYGLQKINTLDEVGMVSPPPGMPFFRGPDEMARYFLDLGYHYLVYSPDEISDFLYSKRVWEKKSDSSFSLLRDWAPYVLDFLNNVKKLEGQGAVVFSTRYLRVISLDIAANNKPGTAR